MTRARAILTILALLIVTPAAALHGLVAATIALVAVAMVAEGKGAQPDGSDDRQRGQGGNTDDGGLAPAVAPHRTPGGPDPAPTTGARGAESGNRRSRCRRC